MTIRLLSAFLLTIAMNSGCSFYQAEIQQGNFITPEQVAQVQPGMSQEQVREILGTPLMTDDFRQDRWDYIFYRNSGGNVTRQTGATVFFNTNGTVRDLATN